MRRPPIHRRYTPPRPRPERPQTFTLSLNQLVMALAGGPGLGRAAITVTEAADLDVTDGDLVDAIAAVEERVTSYGAMKVALEGHLRRRTGAAA